MIQNNPKYKQFQGVTEDAEKYIYANGGNPETAFRKFASEIGVDADNTINLIAKLFNK